MTCDERAAPRRHDAFEISRDEIERRLGDPSLVLLNVLPDGAFAEGHIPGSLNLPVAEIAHRAGEILPDRRQEIAVYCAAPT